MKQNKIERRSGQPMIKHPESRAWFMWSFGGLFYCYQFILRVSPSVMTDSLMFDFSVEACALGILSSLYYYSYSSLQIPIGIAMDEIGPSWLLRFATLICAAGAFMFGFSDSFYMAGLGRLLIGAGCAAAFLGTLKLATLWFHPERLALVVGFTLLAGKIGATLGQGPLALLVDEIGWRYSMQILAVLGLFLSLAIWIFVKDNPPESYEIHMSQRKKTSIKEILEKLLSVAADGRVWALGAYGALMYVPLSAFADLWGVPFLIKLYGIDKATASSACTMLFIGAGVGSPIVALISDFFQSRRWPMLISAGLCVVVNAAIIYAPGVSLQMMFALLFLAGFIFAAQPLIFASVCQITNKANNGTAISFTNMIVMISGVVLQPLIGFLLDWVWDGVMDNGIPLYTLDDYRFSLTSVLISLVIAMILTPWIPETYPKRSRETIS